jgi:phospholipid/cholesterol/gamma-HCH transport system substrate-binding protein
VTASRVAVIGLLVAAALLIAFVVLGGNGSHEYKLSFQNAGQIVNGDDVKIGGRPVGKVKKMELTDNNAAEITVKVNEPYAPLHSGTTALVRATSLSGVANRYIALSPAPDSNPQLEDGAVIQQDKTTSIVDLDQILATLDPDTRKGLTKVIQGFGDWYAGKGREANVSSKYFGPALNATRELVKRLNADQRALEGVVVNTSKVVTALAEEGPTLTDLVANTNTTFGAIAAENRALAEALDFLPQTLRRASTTFVNLDATLDDLEELVNVTGESTKNLEPFLNELAPLLKEAQPTVNQLSTLIDKPGPSNDFTDLLNETPALANAAGPGFKNSIGALNKSVPVFAFFRPYSTEFVGWFRDFGQSTANYDANGHYARISPMFNAFGYDQATNTLNPLPDSQRTAGQPNGGVPGVTSPTQLVPRCPGAATQPPADGSAPWRDTRGDLDCDPKIVPPGP